MAHRWYYSYVNPLKLLKFLSNHLLDPNQILNLSFDDRTILFKLFKWRQPPMEDDLKILKAHYLSNHLMDQTQILNLTLMTKPYFINLWNEDDLQCNSSATTYLAKYDSGKRSSDMSMADQSQDHIHPLAVSQPAWWDHRPNLISGASQGCHWPTLFP